MILLPGLSGFGDTTHIGEAIEVGEARVATPKEINELRITYIAALQKLYRDTRPAEYEEEIVIV